ncbi:MAG: 5-oxoprolinase subunit PxpB [Acidobacteriota bacterium]
MSPGPMRWRDVRDGVLLADFPDASDELANRVCVTLCDQLRSANIRGLRDAIPGARSLLVTFDLRRLDGARLRRRMESSITEDPGSRSPRRLMRVPIAYGAEDLQELARARGLSTEEFARRHAEAEYRVAFIGFAPGFAYLTGLPPELHAPRRPSPRPRVAAGSVAIGGPYTGIYPGVSPGGWQLIGKTTVRLFDVDADPPALFRAGDRVRFEPVRLSDLPDLPERSAPVSGGRAILRVVSPGVWTTIQGAPAYGLGSSGVPPGGAMDSDSLARANALVGNAPGEPGLEMGLIGPELEALGDCMVALGGADFDAQWNGKSAPREAAWRMAAGDRLRLVRARRGVRAYVAVAGGLESPGRSGAPAPRLEAGATIAIQPHPPGGSAAAGLPGMRDLSEDLHLRVMLGPEADQFAAAEIDRFLAGSWRVSSESDRRGLRLEGEPPLSHRMAPEIAPSGTVSGSIQVPGSGLPIVLGPDGPVTGGYPRIATVIGADLSALGQAAPGAVVRFRPVSLPQALEARGSSGSTMFLP